MNEDLEKLKEMAMAVWQWTMEHQVLTLLVLCLFQTMRISFYKGRLKEYHSWDYEEEQGEDDDDDESKDLLDRYISSLIEDINHLREVIDDEQTRTLKALEALGKTREDQILWLRSRIDKGAVGNPHNDIFGFGSIPRGPSLAAVGLAPEVTEGVPAADSPM